MDLTTWLNELATEMGGWYDEEDNALLVDTGDMGVNSYRYTEILQMYNSRYSPRETADVLRQGGGL